MRVLFWGTPEFAVPSLRALFGEGHDVAGVVTQPDRPAGRGRRLRPSPVKEAAQAEGVPVLTPERPRGEEFLEEVRALAPEVSVVVAYGHILRPAVLELPPLGSINAHASLLPELRGAAPINWAVVRGHMETGITVMRMTEGMDAGPILLQRALPIGPNDTASGLFLTLSELGAEALMEALPLLALGELEGQAQDDSKATYAPKIDRADARISWTESAGQIGRHIRGMDAVPGAWTEWEGEPVKLFSPVPLEGAQPAEVGAPPASPGTILRADPEDGLIVTAGKGTLRIREVQPPGKRRMEAEAWLRGAGPRAGDRFE